MTELDDGPAPTAPIPRKGLARLVAATRYSIAGLRSAFASEEALRLEAAAFALMAPLGLWLGQSAVEKVLLVGVLVLVILLELLNTAIEAVVDRFGGSYHELSKLAKDVGSATVMISIALVIFTWSMLLLA